MVPERPVYRVPVEPWFISIDVETSGPVPGAYSILSIGACAVEDPSAVFYAELAPESPGADPVALEITGLSLERLEAEGEDPAAAMERFAGWISEVTPAGRHPVMVAFNAPFDWMFVADAFERHLGDNPFGHSALDIKALAMGADRVGWQETSFAAVASRYGIEADLPHHALEDARLQAELFRRIVATIAG